MLFARHRRLRGTSRGSVTARAFACTSSSRQVRRRAPASICGRSPAFVTNGLERAEEQPRRLWLAVEARGELRDERATAPRRRPARSASDRARRDGQRRATAVSVATVERRARLGDDGDRRRLEAKRDRTRRTARRARPAWPRPSEPADRDAAQRHAVRHDRRRRRRASSSLWSSSSVVVVVGGVVVGEHRLTLIARDGERATRRERRQCASRAQRGVPAEDPRIVRDDTVDTRFDQGSCERSIVDRPDEDRDAAPWQRLDRARRRHDRPVAASRPVAPATREPARRAGAAASVRSDASAGARRAARSERGAARRRGGRRGR